MASSSSAYVFMNIIIYVFLYLVLIHDHQSQANIIMQIEDLGESASSPVFAPPTSSSMDIDCGSACGVRCQMSSRPNLCRRICGTCCARCNCVPPGTSGNYEFCPCYFNMTTHGGARKCP
ncbi:gibberellin-regulated protein 11-like [Impatiens glandulifera]|uniref:gibberellin-regulated protein 11-like n=1 Tax=Impatiens glandulifera TaxID=253017 RepID=UPI001FB1814F|nr:gibberellin-regulated protein 11-like [Impatiens glandulifera]